MGILLLYSLTLIFLPFYDLHLTFLCGGPSWSWSYGSWI